LYAKYKYCEQDLEYRFFHNNDIITVFINGYVSNYKIATVMILIIKDKSNHVIYTYN